MKYLVTDFSSPAEIIDCAKAKFTNSVHITRTVSYHELFVLSEGELHMQENGKPFTLRAGDVYISPVGVEFGGTKESTCVFNWLHFNLPNEKNVESADLTDKNTKDVYIPTFCHLSDTADIISLINQLKQTHIYASGVEKAIIRNSLTTCLLAQIARKNSFQKKPKKVSGRLNSILEFLAFDPYLTECDNVKDMAKLFSYNEKYLIKLFKTNLGITPLQYITEEKIKRAKEFLADPLLTIEWIATKLKYEYSYFLKLFKRKTGLTPSEYRNSITPIRVRNTP